MPAFVLSSYMPRPVDIGDIVRCGLVGLVRRVSSETDREGAVGHCRRADESAYTVPSQYLAACREVSGREPRIHVLEDCKTDSGSGLVSQNTTQTRLDARDYIDKFSVLYLPTGNSELYCYIGM
jgi:hypothetical protein